MSDLMDGTCCLDKPCRAVRDIQEERDLLRMVVARVEAIINNPKAVDRADLILALQRNSRDDVQTLSEHDVALIQHAVSAVADDEDDRNSWDGGGS